jgi:hypothetical protein
MENYFVINIGYPIHKVTIQYIPGNEETKAALSFQLSGIEKRDIGASLDSKHNKENFTKAAALLNAVGDRNR